jgi:uncharacterized protein (DUF1697 family)
MTVYIALLRGINVGGKNIIKMADLKRVFDSIGLCEVKTYIQSGNVLCIRNSKLANNLYKLNVSTTVRNWKTLSKLAVLAKAMEI